MTQPQPINYSVPPKNNPLALTSMVLGIVAFPVSCVPFLNYVCWIAAITAIVLGFVARKQIAQGQGVGAGMAMAGIILGCVYLALAIVMVILVLAFGVTVLHFMQKAAQQQQQNRTSTGSSATQLFRHVFESTWLLGRAWLGR